MAMTRPPLLALLARQGWFTRMGEPAVTQLLSALLEQAELNEAVLRLFHVQGGPPLPSVVEWRAEQVQTDGGRTDLEGLDAQGRPVVVIEVKFGANLTPGQMSSYLVAQRRRLGDNAGLLVALVPEYRRVESEHVLGLARQEAGLAQTRSLTISWDQWLDAWHAADVPEEVRADLIQLRGLCSALSGLKIPPFETAPGPEWAERETDLLGLLEMVARLLAPDGARLPSQGRDEYEWYLGRRYVGPVKPLDAAVSVGLVGEWAAEGDAALWIRFHKQTPGFAEIERRVRRSPLSAQARTHGGHVWLPIEIPLGVAGEHLAAQVAASIRAKIQMVDLKLP